MDTREVHQKGRFYSGLAYFQVEVFDWPCRSIAILTPTIKSELRTPRRQTHVIELLDTAQWRTGSSIATSLLDHVCPPISNRHYSTLLFTTHAARLHHHQSSNHGYFADHLEAQHRPELPRRRLRDLAGQGEPRRRRSRSSQGRLPSHRYRPHVRILPPRGASLHASYSS